MVFAVVELATVGLITIWFAAGSLVAMILATFGAGVPLQVAAFVIVSVVMIFFSPNAYRRVKTCRIGVMSTLLTAVLLIWSIISFGGVSTFLYMNF